MSGHAVLSPSSAHRWLRCTGSVELSRGLNDESSAHADEGTRAHELAAAMLLGQPHSTDDEEMVRWVTKYVDFVNDLCGPLGALMVEQRVLAHIGSGLTEIFGTADAIILRPEGEVIVVDLKYGRGVEVSAEGNEQLMLYALGAIWHFEDYLPEGVKSIRLCIAQPRIGNWSEHVLTVKELKEFEKFVSQRVEAINIGETEFAPSEKACRWCRAKAICPALAEEVESLFEEVKPTPTTSAPELSYAMKNVGMVEAWCAAIRAEVERRLLAGEPVSGFKLVRGRAGARRWADPDAAEEILKSKARLRTDLMYSMKLISPTEAEKLADAKEIGPRVWKTLQEQIVRAEGSLSVAPEEDKRPAVSAAATPEDFN